METIEIAERVLKEEVDLLRRTNITYQPIVLLIARLIE